MFENFKEYTEKFKDLSKVNSGKALCWYDFPSAILKRELQIMIAKNFKFNSILDAYAGIGYSSLIYSECSKNIICIERNKKYYNLLKINTHNRFTYYNYDNIKVFKYFIQKGVKFDFIDIDPFGNCYKQIKFLDRLVNDNFLISITTGEIFTIRRNLTKNTIIESMYPDIDISKYKGLNLIGFLNLFIEKLRELIKIDFKVYYYFISQQIIRILYR